MNVSGLVLAAGNSYRMGRDKQSLPFQGMPILQHAINAARSSCLSSVTAVIPPQSKLERDVSFNGCRVVTIAEIKRSQSASLQAGLKEIMGESDGCMVLLGDQPLVTSAIIDRLAQEFFQHPKSWIIPVRNGKRGNPVIIPSGWYTEVLKIKGDTGARTLFDLPNLDMQMVDIKEIGPFFDVDTPEQYQQLINKYDQTNI